MSKEPMLEPDTEIGVLIHVHYQDEPRPEADLPPGKYGTVVQVSDVFFTVDASGVVGGNPHLVEQKLMGRLREDMSITEWAALGLARLAQRREETSHERPNPQG